MGARDLDQVAVDSNTVHETNNTRTIEELCRTHRWLTNVFSPSLVLQGIATIEANGPNIAPEHIGVNKPFYNLCVYSTRNTGWRALPMTEKWLEPIGISKERLLSLSRIEQDIYSVEKLDSGLLVVSPHINVVSFCLGAGLHLVFQTNYSKDPEFRRQFDEITHQHRVKRIIEGLS